LPLAWGAAVAWGSWPNTDGDMESFRASWQLNPLAEFILKKIADRGYATILP
jgi:hypothetical protein